MSDDFQEQVRQAVERMREQQERLSELQRDLEQKTVSVRSKDRMVTATVGAQGQVVSLEFHTTAYRGMAPAELGNALVGVLNEARATMGKKIIEAVRPLGDFGQVRKHLPHMAAQDVEQALAPLIAMEPDFEATELVSARRKIKKGQKQEEFEE
jgi:DNA-binding protein YbaB